ncbi:uncharacterized protein LOC143285303 [Babylonia areolata]|uniref:uncharacterized protein LOC143285303 n=1 Tax=Babylonia areolata TaxID=304850 RepID=UPI003FD69F18
MAVAHKFAEKTRTSDVIISETVDFSGLLLSKPVLNGLKNAGFERPSPIQLKAIPLGRCGLDLIVQAKSGTGKTCVFSVVALEGIEPTTSSTQVLVLAPTREIAVQIWEVMCSLGSCVANLHCHTFIGGMPLQEDRRKLQLCHIAVGTPGRIQSLIEQGLLKTQSIRLFVLDEADKLLEEGFQPQINWIYSALPDNKQMLALSATYPEYLADHLTLYMRNPTFVRLNVTDPTLLGIKQYYSTVASHPLPHRQFEMKTQAVVRLLSSVAFNQCLIFSNWQTRAQNLQSELSAQGWPTSCIAGCLDQKDRISAITQLKTYTCRVLISTDLTSRGIDADRVNLVINLDVPGDQETYLHRIGRAGRFGSYGAAVSIVSEGQELMELHKIEHSITTNILPLPDPIPSDLVKRQLPVRLEDMVSTHQILTRPDQHAASFAPQAPAGTSSDETSHISTLSNGTQHVNTLSNGTAHISTSSDDATHISTLSNGTPHMDRHFHNGSRIGEDAGLRGQWVEEGTNTKEGVTEEGVTEGTDTKKGVTGEGTDTKKGVTEEGTDTKEGVTEEGTDTKEGVTEEGTDTKEGVTEEGTDTKKGVTGEGTDTEEGVTEEGVTREGTDTREGVTEGGTDTKEGVTEEGTDTKEGVTEEGTDTKEGVTEEGTDTKEGVTEGGTDTKEGVTEEGTDTKEGVTEEGIDTKEGVTEGGTVTKEGVTEEGTDTKEGLTEEGTDTKEGVTEEGTDTKEGVTEEGIDTKEGVTEEGTDTKEGLTEEGTDTKEGVTEEGTDTKEGVTKEGTDMKGGVTRGAVKSRKGRASGDLWASMLMEQEENTHRPPVAEDPVAVKEHKASQQRKSCSAGRKDVAWDEELALYLAARSQHNRAAQTSADSQGHDTQPRVHRPISRARRCLTAGRLTDHKGHNSPTMIPTSSLTHTLTGAGMDRGAGKSSHTATVDVPPGMTCVKTLSVNEHESELPVMPACVKQSSPPDGQKQRGGEDLWVGEPNGCHLTLQKADAVDSCSVPHQMLQKEDAVDSCSVCPPKVSISFERWAESGGVAPTFSSALDSYRQCSPTLLSAVKTVQASSPVGKTPQALVTQTFVPPACVGDRQCQQVLQFLDQFYRHLGTGQGAPGTEDSNLPDTAGQRVVTTDTDKDSAGGVKGPGPVVSAGQTGSSLGGDNRASGQRENEHLPVGRTREVTGRSQRAPRYRPMAVCGPATAHMFHWHHHQPHNTPTPSGTAGDTASDLNTDEGHASSTACVKVERSSELNSTGALSTQPLEGHSTGALEGHRAGALSATPLEGHSSPKTAGVPEPREVTVGVSGPEKEDKGGGDVSGDPAVASRHTLTHTARAPPQSASGTDRQQTVTGVLSGRRRVVCQKEDRPQAVTGTGVPLTGGKGAVAKQAIARPAGVAPWEKGARPQAQSGPHRTQNSDEDSTCFSSSSSSSTTEAVEAARRGKEEEWMCFQNQHAVDTLGWAGSRRHKGQGPWYQGELSSSPEETPPRHGREGPGRHGREGPRRHGAVCHSAPGSQHCWFPSYNYHPTQRPSHSASHTVSAPFVPSFRTTYCPTFPTYPSTSYLSTGAHPSPQSVYMGPREEHLYPPHVPQEMHNLGHPHFSASMMHNPVHPFPVSQHTSDPRHQPHGRCRECCWHQPVTDHCWHSYQPFTGHSRQPVTDHSWHQPQPCGPLPSAAVSHSLSNSQVSKAHSLHSYIRSMARFYARFCSRDN